MQRCSSEATTAGPLSTCATPVPRPTFAPSGITVSGIGWQPGLRMNLHQLGDCVGRGVLVSFRGVGSIKALRALFRSNHTPQNLTLDA